MDRSSHKATWVTRTETLLGPTHSYGSGLIRTSRIRCSIVGWQRKKIFHQRLFGVFTGERAVLAMKVSCNLVSNKVGMIPRSLWKRRFHSHTCIYALMSQCHRLVFRYIFIPWLQNELDEYVVKNNTTKKRHNRKVARPNGVPLLVEQAPERFDARDYKVFFSMSICCTYVDS